MPQASNFTIKDGASTPVDVVFTCVQNAGGNLPTTYYARSRGASPAHQPVIRISAKGTTQGREVRQTISVPYVVTGTDGSTKVISSGFIEIKAVLPDSIPDAIRADLRAYVANSLDVTQISEAFREGFAPN